MRADQIQEFCFTFVYGKHQPDSTLEEAISVAAYQNGIDTSQVLDVLAVVLRDELTGRLV